MPRLRLFAVDGDELRRHVRRTAEHAALVGEGAALDADHVGAVVAEELAGLGPGHELRELEHAQPGERRPAGCRARGATANRGSANGDSPRAQRAAYGFGVGAGTWARRGGSRRAGRRTRSSPRAARRRWPSTIVVANVPRVAHRLAGDQLGRRQHRRDGNVAPSAPRRRSPRSTCPRTACRRSPASTSGWRFRPP